MKTEEPRVTKALKLVDAGLSVAEAAKELGISAAAVYEAKKVRAGWASMPAEEKTCSECGAILPAGVRPMTKTCSPKCRTARSRRIIREMERRAMEKINAERLKLGLPPKL